MSISFNTPLLRVKKGEDRYLQQTYRQKDGGKIHVLAVFDGHGGRACVEWCRNHVSDYLAEKIPSLEPKSSNYRQFLDDLIKELVRGWDQICFPGMDNSTREDKQQYINNNNQLYFGKNLCSGSTCCLCLIDESKSEVHCATLGDSRWFIHANDGYVIRSFDHTNVKTSENMDEQNRPFVDPDGYLNGELAMSHSVGDNTSNLLGFVKRNPCICTHKISGPCKVIVATDGCVPLFDDTEPFAHKPEQTVDRINAWATLDVPLDDDVAVLVANIPIITVSIPKGTSKKSSTKGQYYSPDTSTPTPRVTTRRPSTRRRTPLSSE